MYFHLIPQPVLTIDNISISVELTLNQFNRWQEIGAHVTTQFIRIVHNV